jgi:hypothetical protein
MFHCVDINVTQASALTVTDPVDIQSGRSRGIPPCRWDD